MVDRRYHRLCAWAGPTFAVLFGLGFWVFAGYLPPHQPAADAEHIAAVLMIGSCLLLAFVAEILERVVRVLAARARVLYVGGADDGAAAPGDPAQLTAGVWSFRQSPERILPA